jgi:hypothetical protein
VRPAEVEGCCGKQPDGSAKIRGVMLATVWTADGRDPQGRPIRDPGTISYNAAVESPSCESGWQPVGCRGRPHRHP